MAQSLFRACKNVIRNGAGSVQNVGGYDVGIEYYTQEDIDENVRKIKFGEASACTFGDSDESKVVLVASPEITIPAMAGNTPFVLTPTSPKKSLVIICNTLVNEGTISMTSKAPNVLPHSWNIVNGNDGYTDNVIIPAYANNGVPRSYYTGNGNGRTGTRGNNGIARQCGSGGMGSMKGRDEYNCASGSGYAFGGGAGSGGVYSENAGTNTVSVDAVYPMRGGNGFTNPANHPYLHAYGGVGNPAGINASGSSRVFTQNVGCGGRIIIFCNNFINKGTISSNGTSSKNMEIGENGNTPCVMGGASGAGAIDLFYVSMTNDGNIVANGGTGGFTTRSGGQFGPISGAGGNGCITYSDGDMAPLWVMPDVFKPRRKKFTKDNWTYLFGEYVDRLNQEV